MITDVEGVLVGHWTDAAARTGCTVTLFPEGTVASGEVRGGAPATREFALLEPTRMVQRIDAVVLTGGSAFGLASADGVMEWLADRDRGFETVGGVVPIVVAMGLFDLAVGDGSVRPGADHGRRAAEQARSGPHDVGAVGAGTGATVAKWRGPEHRRPGGLVTRSVTGDDGLVVSALVAVNAFGEPGANPDDVAGGSTAERAERNQPEGLARRSAQGGDAERVDRDDTAEAFQHTTIGVVATNARIDKLGCHLAAQSAHDGLARAVAPSHTSADGDAFVVAATGAVDADVAAVRNLVTAAVAGAISSLGP